MIAVTIIRVSGLKSPQGQLDSLWEDYWNLLSSEVGIIMTAATAFRTLFISRSNGGNNRNQGVRSPGTFTRIPFSWSQWLTENKRYLQQTFNLRAWRSRKSSDPSNGPTSGSTDEESGNLELPVIPRAHMTGIRTFIRGQGRKSAMLHASQIMQTRTEDLDTIPVLNADDARKTNFRGDERSPDEKKENGE